jgi:hypothetical protein
LHSRHLHQLPVLIRVTQPKTRILRVFFCVNSLHLFVFVCLQQAIFRVR